jgi:hypothetical protein
MVMDPPGLIGDPEKAIAWVVVGRGILIGVFQLVNGKK